MMMMHELLTKAIHQEYEDQLVRRQKEREMEQAWWTWGAPKPPERVFKKVSSWIEGIVYWLVERLYKTRRVEESRRKALKETMPLPLLNKRGSA